MQCDVLSFMVEGATVFRIVIEVKVEAARKYVIIRTPLEVRAAHIPLLHQPIENDRFHVRQVRNLTNEIMEFSADKKECVEVLAGRTACLPAGASFK